MKRIIGLLTLLAVVTGVAASTVTSDVKTVSADTQTTQVSHVAHPINLDFKSMPFN